MEGLRQEGKSLPVFYLAFWHNGPSRKLEKISWCQTVQWGVASDNQRGISVMSQSYINKRWVGTL